MNVRILLRLRSATALLLGLALLGLACAQREEGTLAKIRRTGVLRVGTDATYPPFETIDPASGGLVGFDIDLVRALAERLSARAEFVIVPFDGIVPGLKSGHYDLVVSAMTITAERARQVRFTRPYTVAGQSIVVRRAAATLRSAADLAGKRIGCQLATTGEMEAKKVPGARVVSFDAIGSAFRDLENGNLDAAIADTPTARIFLRDHPALELAGQPLTREEFGMAARLEDQALVEALDRGLEALRATGEMRALESRWGIVASDGRP